MAEDNYLNNNLTQKSQQPKQNNQSKPLLIIVIAFAVLWIIVLMTQKRNLINWIKDYNVGVELAREQNKPLLLVFYKSNAPMYISAANDTYQNSEVKKFVETTFVPVLINVEDNADIAKLYNINYYPTIYVKEADSDEKFGPRLGYDPPVLFIKEINNLLNELKKSKE